MKQTSKIFLLIICFFFCATMFAQMQTSVNSLVHIQQIGNDNVLSTNLHTNKSLVNTFQSGTNNKILINFNGMAINEYIVQKGTNNNFIDFNLASNTIKEHKITVLQKGKNQNLIMYGSNSISEKMKISMRGKQQTVIIRSVKR